MKTRTKKLLLALGLLFVFPFLTAFLAATRHSEAIGAGSLNWTGATDTKWSNAGNWDPGASPSRFESLAFPPDQNPVSENDATPDVINPLDSISFTGNGYTLSQNGVNLVNGITDSSINGSNVINLESLGLVEPQTYMASQDDEELIINSPISLGENDLTLAGNGSITLAGDISGPARLIKNDIGTAILSGTNSQRATIINNGVLETRSNSALGGSVAVGTTGTLRLNNDGNLTLTNAFLMESGASPALENEIGSNSINGPDSEMTLSQDASIDVANGTSLTINQLINENGGSYGIRKTGEGQLTLTNDNTYTGQTIVDGGILAVYGSQGGSDVVANPDTSVWADGTVGAISLHGATLVPQGIEAGSGTINCNGFSMDADSTLAININGSPDGSDYDRIIANGPVTLAGTLEMDYLAPYYAQKGDTFTLIRNNSKSPVTGNFDNLTEGATIKYGYNTFRISYLGGENGNDVTLTSLSGSYNWVNYTDTLWNTADAWDPSSPPDADSNLIFGEIDLNSPYIAENDISSGFSANSIIFGISNYDLTGLPVDVLSNITDNGPGPSNTIEHDVNFTGDGPYDIRVENAKETLDFESKGRGINLGGNTLSLYGDGKISFNTGIAGEGDVSKNDAGIVLFAGANDYSGATYINGGTLIIGTGPNLAIPDTSDVTVRAGATLDLNGNEETIASLTGDGGVNLGRGILTLDLESPAGIFGGAISGVGGQLTKRGVGTFTLQGDNTYTGTTDVAAGKLIINGAQPNSAVTVESGAILGGNGTTGPVTVTGGTVTPGASPGILNTGSITFDSASSINIEINGTTPGADYSQLNVRGTVDLGGSTLNLSVGYSPVVGDTYKIVQSSGALTGTFTDLPDGGTFNVGSGAFTIKYNANDVTIVASTQHHGGGHHYSYASTPTQQTSETSGNGPTQQQGGNHSQNQPTQQTTETSQNQPTQETSETSQTQPPGQPPAHPLVGEDFYLDATGHWARSRITQLTNTCRIAGYTDLAGNLLRVFHADKGITRAELYTMTMKCKFGPLPAPNIAPFPDIPAGSWAAPYIDKAKSLGLAKGFPDGLFRPDWTIARADALKIILLSWFQRADINAADPSSRCSDIPPDALYAPFFYYGLDNNYIQGFLDYSGTPLGVCKPATKMSRAEAAEVIMAIEDSLAGR